MGQTGLADSPHVLLITLWISDGFCERLDHPRIKVSHCLFLGHLYHVRKATTNGGLGSLCDVFHTFLAVGIFWCKIAVEQVG